jgi:hypothetical protein
MNMYSFSHEDFPQRVYPNGRLGLFVYANPSGVKAETLLVETPDGGFVEKSIVPKVVGHVVSAKVVQYGSKQFYEVRVSSPESQFPFEIATMADSAEAEILKQAIAAMDREQPAEFRYFKGVTNRNLLGVFQEGKSLVK